MKNGTRGMKPANDPSFDPVLTLILRYIRPLALSGIAFTFVAIGWVLSL